MVKKCSECEILLTGDNVYFRQSGQSSGKCKPCESDYNKALAKKGNSKNGYTGNGSRPEFVLPPGCLFASHLPPFADNDYFGPEGLKLLTAPSGQPVIRPHQADEPGEVCWVLR